MVLMFLRIAYIEKLVGMQRQTVGSMISEAKNEETEMHAAQHRNVQVTYSILKNGQFRECLASGCQAVVESSTGSIL